MLFVERLDDLADEKADLDSNIEKFNKMKILLNLESSFKLNDNDNESILRK